MNRIGEANPTMLTNNPFAEVSAVIPASAIQWFVIVMIVLVIAGTLFDVIHKKSAQYFSENMRKQKERADEECDFHGRDYDPSRERALDRRRGTPARCEDFS